MTGHLIHIGYPKTGSNFLRRWFAAHPQLTYLEGGIAGFAGAYDIARQGVSAANGRLYRVTSAEGLATPHEHVGMDRIDYERVRSRPMPPSQAAVCDSLASVFPNAHILIVTRGFRGMLRSAYSQYVRTGGEDSFERFCAYAQKGIETGQDAWRYDYLVALYREAFSDRVITLPYELLRDDSRSFLAEIERRLGLDHHEFVGEQSNRSLSPVELAWYLRLTRWVRLLPLGGRIRASYLRMALANRLARPIALLQRARPVSPVDLDTVSEALIEGYAGRSEPFRDDPLYAPYAKDYLLR